MVMITSSSPKRKELSTSNTSLSTWCLEVLALLKSPLHNVHVELKASFGEFAGWEMPLTYESGVKEHLAVRTSAGVFDISHMGRIIVKGDEAFTFLQKLVPKDLSETPPGYMSGPTAFLNEKAGFKDDVMLYNLGDNKWLIVCNAVNREKIIDWLGNWKAKWGMSVEVIDETMNIAMLALQGPKSAEYMEKVGLKQVLDLKMLQFKTDIETRYGKLFLVSRSGWTGEDGFEILGKPEVVEKLLRELVERGVKPAGLAARDTLRLEMGFVLYGHDIDEDITPVEARYWVWTPGKKGYIGYEALMEKLRKGVDKIRVGVKMKKKVKAIPREGDRIVVEGVEVGRITSGNYSPTMKRGIAMGYVSSRHALIGLNIEVDIRGRLHPGKLSDFPLYKKG